MGWHFPKVTLQTGKDAKHFKGGIERFFQSSQSLSARGDHQDVEEMLLQTF